MRHTPQFAAHPASNGRDTADLEVVLMKPFLKRPRLPVCNIVPSSFSSSFSKTAHDRGRERGRGFNPKLDGCLQDVRYSATWKSAPPWRIELCSIRGRPEFVRRSCRRHRSAYGVIDREQTKHDENGFRRVQERDRSVRQSETNFSSERTVNNRAAALTFFQNWRKFCC
jgi:hypothetical protein